MRQDGRAEFISASLRWLCRIYQCFLYISRRVYRIDDQRSTIMRRIIKIAVRFLHTKTALCDRKDTQSRFAVNAARSIVCVETSSTRSSLTGLPQFQCRTQHCVCRDIVAFCCVVYTVNVSMPHAALCVSRPQRADSLKLRLAVSMPHAALCVSRRCVPQPLSRAG